MPNMAQFVQEEDTSTCWALSLPEIVTERLYQIYEDFRQCSDNTIFACTLVTWLWHAEANRYIWETCGELQGSTMQPAIRHLIAIEPHRRQIYANHIRILEVSNEEDRDHENVHWEGRFHRQLALLSFPRLEQLSMEGTSFSITSYYNEPPFTQYLQSRLKTITLRTCQEPANLVISEHFLNEIKRRCQNLTELYCFISHDGHGISSEVLTSFLREMLQITDLFLGNAFLNVVSSEAFQALARYTSLTRLEIPEIPDSWIDELQLCSSQNPFASLLSLDCSISCHGLERLLPFIKDLYHLAVIVPEGSAQMFEIIANAGLTELQHLGLQPCSGFTIHAHDLLSLVRSATNLDTLDIPDSNLYREDEAPLPVLQDLDDAIMDEIATCLPYITYFQLIFDQKGLTERSLISLGTHCPELKYCKLTADVNYEKLAQNAQPGLWPQLYSMRLYRPENEDEDPGETQVATLHKPREIAEKISRLMPALRSVDLVDDWKFESVLSEVLRSLTD
ncbi:hypothetical protein K461DRAFT_52563 [Myriangium duriaei CBS 260.36]|uniref:Uncharacterized protein n=1 Tax=Myriangium duriaei CBS 260.36 TaxID=1168546 RepID=A0A9P4IXX0_9PEZI|nr:hypothetical protein K461DRAFT_52563 [Myriangium duriaei CBS 260.36]